MKLSARAGNVRSVAALCAMLLCAACAARLPSLPPPGNKHPDFVYPAVPADQQKTPAAERVARGWRFLQNDDLPIAALEFRAALVRAPEFSPAHTGQGYVALAERNYVGALASFDAALKSSSRYVPALVGRGQTLLAVGRENEALATLEIALAVDSSLTDLRRRVDVLRFRNLQDTIDVARSAAAAGRLDDARAAYRRALDASPDSAFLHRELAAVERRRGEMTLAFEHFQRAAELDASDLVSLVAMGELLEARRDFVAAEGAYRRAAAIEPSDDLTTKIAAVAEAAREASLPAEFQNILQSPQITRGDLAALIGVRLNAVIQAAPRAQVVVTDTRGHWATRWITDVAVAGVMEPFQNHTFQPQARLQRAGLAAAVNRLVRLMASTDPMLRAHLSARPAIADMNPRHLSYPDVAVAVATNVLPLLEGDRFQPARPVSGLEAVEAIDRLKALPPSTR